jgi:uncharacterized protein
VSVYLDASVLVPLFADDPFSNDATEFVRNQQDGIIVSDFAATEFASAMSRLVRNGDLTRNHALKAFTNFDTWLIQGAQRAPIDSADIVTAAALLRRLDTNLRAPDAIHLAVSRRLGAQLFTFDRKLAESAKKLGIALASR